MNKGVLNKMKNVVLLLIASTSLLLATVKEDSDKDILYPTEIKTPVLYNDLKQWSIELGSGTNFSNIRTDNKAYTLVPVSLTLSHALDSVSLEGWRRGYTEFFVTGYHTFITDGPESRVSGFNVGPRYNFVQDGWSLIPFIEANVGLGFSNSNPDDRGLGQDFCFEFGVSSGVKYMLFNDIFVRLSCDYTHYSNGGLSEDNSKNNPIDALGFRAGLGLEF